MAETQLVITSSFAPRLVYAHSDGQSLTQVDYVAPEDARERAICRALLVHALALLDDAN